MRVRQACFVSKGRFLKSLHQILNLLGQNTDGISDAMISAVHNDSRQVAANDLFLAYPGACLDGRDYIARAIAMGAAACLVEMLGFQPQHTYSVPVIAVPNLQDRVCDIAAFFMDEPATHLDLVGVTGTSGKSSCVHFIAQALGSLDCKTGVLGTIGNGVWPHLTASSLTTLDGIGVNRYLQHFLTDGVSRVAMEVSSHALSQKRVYGLPFKIAVFTSLSHEHLDYHGSMEAYARAKFELFHYPSLEAGVVNLDDHYGRLLVKERDDIRWLGYTVDGEFSVPGIDIIRASNVVCDQNGVSFDVDTPTVSLSVSLPLLGRFNIGNVLAVIGVLEHLGLTQEQIQRAVSGLTTIEGRMQVLTTRGAPTVVVDYAHKPGALENALGAVKQHFSGQVYCVFGCGGERDRSKRPLMAKIAEQSAAQVIVTSDNCRGEPLEQIWSDIRQGFSSMAHVKEIADRSDAIAYAVQSAGIGDIVFLAGMGHELVSVDSEKSLLTDFEIAQRALAKHSVE